MDHVFCPLGFYVIFLLHLVKFFSLPLCSGRLIRTLADVQYRNYHMTTVEIVYNIISFIIAIVTTVAFTVYAKRALNELQKAETNGEAAAGNHGNSDMEKLPLERPKHTRL